MKGPSCDVNKKGDFGRTVLHEEAHKGRLEVVRTLVEAGANVNERDAFGETPLFRAARYGHADVVKLLLEKCADPFISDVTRFSPLHAATSSNHVECVAVLLSFVSGSSCTFDSYGRTPLHEAVLCKKSTDCLFLLLQVGSPPVDIMDYEGHTPLYIAIRWEMRDATKMLLDFGAQISLVRLDVEGSENAYVTPPMLELPSWVGDHITRREYCKRAAWSVLELQKRQSTCIGRNGRDVLRIVAKMIWRNRWF